MVSSEAQFDVRAKLGNPKITFITGAPGSGKGTQCEKLVEEFGYTHISTGDLIRMEIKKGTNDGNRLKQFVEQGQNAPLDLTTGLLVNALIANPSMNYLIDGFPREVEQCTYFETHVCEAQNVLFFDCSKETCVERLNGRGQGRSDDNAEAIEKRFTTYQEKNLPVIDYYEQFGKVRRVDANRDVQDIYTDTRRAMLPQISWICGPKASGKSTLGKALCERTNMKVINFNDFLASKNLSETDCATKTGALIKQMSQEISPRVLLEDFPQTQLQAKFFMKNCVAPSRVFVLECSMDLCQERMISLDPSDPRYQASAILSKRIREYNQNIKQLLPFLKENTNLRCINTEQNFDQSFQQLSSNVEPSILLVRAGGADNAESSQKAIIAELTSSKGFKELSVFSLVQEETERNTKVGCMIKEKREAGEAIDDCVVEMLKKIIYSGIEGRDKFILTDFPKTIQQAQVFERECSKLRAVIFAAGGDGGAPSIQIRDNGLITESIDSLFQKEHRLKTMREWDESTFNEHLGNKTDWGIVIGQSLSGKSLVASIITESTNGKVIDLAKLAESIRPKLETEADGPFEGRIPDVHVEKEILNIVSANKESGEKFFYLIDGQHHETVEAQATFLSTNLGAPTRIITCSADMETIVNRFKEKNEIADELGEEDMAALKEKATQATEDAAKLRACWADILKRVQEISLDTGVSKEGLVADIRSKFSAKVILVNHEKTIDVDTSCSNLAIKYNMLYMSVYQLIKSEITAETELGRALALSKRQKELDFGATEITDDQFEEKDYSAVHFDQTLVMNLVQQKIAENRTGQSHILLEGFCNSNKLESEKQRLQLRFMDEFFNIEKNIGEVVGVIGLQFSKESTTFDITADMIEDIVVEEVKEEAAKEDGAEGSDAEDAKEEADEEENKKPSWNPTEYKWTKTNRLSKNLPQLFRDYMGNRCNFGEQNWKTYQSATHEDAAVKALDEFCAKITENDSMTMYQQVIFNDQD